MISFNCRLFIHSTNKSLSTSGKQELLHSVVITEAERVRYSIHLLTTMGICNLMRDFLGFFFLVHVSFAIYPREVWNQESTLQESEPFV